MSGRIQGGKQLLKTVSKEPLRTKWPVTGFTTRPDPSNETGRCVFAIHLPLKWMYLLSVCVFIVYLQALQFFFV